MNSICYKYWNGQDPALTDYSSKQAKAICLFDTKLNNKKGGQNAKTDQFSSQKVCVLQKPGRFRPWRVL